MYSEAYLLTLSFFQKALRASGPETLHDTLTGVIAHPYILSFIHTLTERGVPFTLAIIDLDNFKHVNDHYGHEIGDRVLSEIAAALRDAVGTDGVVGRFSVDVDSKKGLSCYAPIFWEALRKRKETVIG